MKLDKDTLQKMAHLARIEIKPEDEASLLQDMEQILSWIEKLNELDTTHVKPLTHMSPERNTWRDDVPSNTLDRNAALNQAPAHDKDHYLVPRVIE